MFVGVGVDVSVDVGVKVGDSIEIAVGNGFTNGEQALKTKINKNTFFIYSCGLISSIARL